MTIPFTQYLLPDGRKREIEFVASPEIHDLAHVLISKGVKFDAEILQTGVVSMTAFIDEDEPLSMELSANGPEIEEAIIKLVKNANEALNNPKVQ